MEIRKISRRRPRSVDHAELVHFTFLFCTGRLRNVKYPIEIKGQLINKAVVKPIFNLSFGSFDSGSLSNDDDGGDADGEDNAK